MKFSPRRRVNLKKNTSNPTSGKNSRGDTKMTSQTIYLPPSPHSEETKEYEMLQLPAQQLKAINELNEEAFSTLQSSKPEAAVHYKR